MDKESYVDTDAEEYFAELADISVKAGKMFEEFKTINLEPAAITLSQEVHLAEHPLKQLYIHGRSDTYDLGLTISTAFCECNSVKEFVNQIDNTLTDPKLKVFDEAYEYITQYGDDGTFKDMIYLYYDVMKLYKRTRRQLKRLEHTATARIEQMY
ncbi:hypothetical protein I3256_06565 [Photobacterium damselae]|uniref:hypothetical protein n=1 Tax=Photobacterium damselae TaxID=38293 RepID=UPI001EDF5C07|nr:hypothetical protein [Photobacterium damselae]MCG3815591.1 hypothetical protein [Photobacterium damselae]